MTDAGSGRPIMTGAGICRMLLPDGQTCALPRRHRTPHNPVAPAEAAEAREVTEAALAALDGVSLPWAVLGRLAATAPAELLAAIRDTGQGE